MPVYKDNALNRCLKRVGKSWGGKGKAPKAPKKMGRPRGKAGVGFTRTKMVGKSAPAYDKEEKKTTKTKSAFGFMGTLGGKQMGKEKGGLAKKYVKEKGWGASYKPSLGTISERMRKERSDKGKKRGKK